MQELVWFRMPRFSVLVPTRDRPDLVGFCLEALAAQTLPDVEVVVADNPVEAPARAVFERWRKPGWKYLRAPEPLRMADNWEFGIQHVGGDFVAVLADKWILHPSAFERVQAALQSDSDADIVSWWSDDYNPLFPKHEVGTGTFRVTSGIHTPVHFDPREELRELFSFGYRRGFDPIHKWRGKIYFGAFSHELLERIRATCGNVFFPLCPDYTSAVPALALARVAIDMGRPLLLTHSAGRSNGNQVSIRPAYAKSFVLENDPDALGRPPIPGLYASSHNIIAQDLLASAARLPANAVPELDRRNLLRRAREDLDGAIWDSTVERDEQYAVLEAEEARLGVIPAQSDSHPETNLSSGEALRNMAAAMLQRVPPAERATRWAHRRLIASNPKANGTFASPLAAAFVADGIYSGVSRGTPPKA